MPRTPRLRAAALAILAVTLSACARSVPARETPPSLATPTARPGVVGTPAADQVTPGAPATPPAQEETNQVVGTIHIVQEGDTLFSLANRYSVSVQAIMEANGISDPDIELQAGSTLVIPIESLTGDQTSASETTAPETYTVQPGDTLVTIAQRFGVTVEALIATNDLANPEMLGVGQVLTLPDGASSEGSGSAAGSSSVGTTYTVQPGDTLETIAQAYGTTQAAILAANNLESSTQIQAGQVLTIPNEQNLGK